MSLTTLRMKDRTPISQDRMSNWVASRVVHSHSIFFLESVGDIIFNDRVVRLEGANHGVEGCIHANRSFVGRIGEDESGQASCIGAKGDVVKDSEDGLSKADHIVICWRAEDGGVALLIYVEQGDDG